MSTATTHVDRRPSQQQAARRSRSVDRSVQRTTSEASSRLGYGPVSPRSQATSGRSRAWSPDAMSATSAVTMPTIICRVFVPRVGWGTQVCKLSYS